MYFFLQLKWLPQSSCKYSELSHLWCWSWRRLKECVTFTPRVLGRSKNWVAARIAHLQTAWPCLVPDILSAVGTNIIKWPITLSLILITALDFRFQFKQHLLHHGWCGHIGDEIRSPRHYHLQNNCLSLWFAAHCSQSWSGPPWLEIIVIIFFITIFCHYHHGLGHVGKAERNRPKFFQSGHKVTIFSCWLVDVLGRTWLRFNMRRSCENLVKLKWQWQWQWQSSAAGLSMYWRRCYDDSTEIETKICSRWKPEQDRWWRRTPSQENILSLKPTIVQIIRCHGRLHSQCLMLV